MNPKPAGNRVALKPTRKEPTPNCDARSGSPASRLRSGSRDPARTHQATMWLDVRQNSGEGFGSALKIRLGLSPVVGGNLGG